MKRLLRLFSAPAMANTITMRERHRFAKSMTGEAAATAAARLGCIAG